MSIACQYRRVLAVKFILIKLVNFWLKILMSDTYAKAEAGYFDDEFYGEQNCENDLTCSKLVTLTKNNQQNTYEASSDRGFITKSWAFCDRDEPDAFQVNKTK